MNEISTRLINYFRNMVEKLLKNPLNHVFKNKTFLFYMIYRRLYVFLLLYAEHCVIFCLSNNFIYINILLDMQLNLSTKLLCVK